MITESEDYDENFVKVRLEVIVAERNEKEAGRKLKAGSEERKLEAEKEEIKRSNKRWKKTRSKKIRKKSGSRKRKK